MNIEIGAGERAVFVGLPGAGKTNLLAWLLEDARSVVIFDSKRHPGEWAAWGSKHGFTVSEDPEDISRYARVVHQVDQRALLDRQGWYRPDRIGHRWTQALARVIKRGNTRVVFDEVIQTLPSGAAHPEATRIYTQGRAFGVGAWAGTQIANRMETLVPRLAEHAFAFRCVHGQDRDLLANARGIDCDALGGLEKFSFAHHRLGETEWRVCQPVELVM